MTLLTIMPASRGMAAPLDYRPHFKTVLINGNAANNTSVTVMMHGDNPRRARKELFSQTITIAGDFFIEMSKGYIIDTDIGHTMVAGDHGLNVLEAREFLGESLPKPSDLKALRRGTFSYEVSTGDLPSGIREEIVGVCDSAGTKTYNFPVAIEVEAARFRRGNTKVNHHAWEVAFGTMPIKVACLPVAQNKAPPKPYSVDVQVEQNGETCPNKTDVTAIIKYKVPATARFRFKVDGKLSEIHEIKARKIEPNKPQSGPGGGVYYLVKRLKTYYLDPGQTHFRVVMEDGSGKKSAVKTVKITCPPFEVTSAWLTYNVSDKLTCAKEVYEKATFNTTRPGSLRYRIKHRGGLVVAEGKIKAKRKGMKYVATAKRTLMMNKFEGEFMAEVVGDTANSGWVPVRVDCLELSGDFSFLDSGGTRCPREGRALINFGMNIAATIHWSLDCNIGNYSGVAQAVSDNKGGYVAPALARFNVEKTTQVTCALKSVSPVNKVHALKWKAYQCIIPSGVSGANDLKPETRPEPDTPRRPDKVVVTPPRQPGVNDRLDEIVVTGSKTEVACYGGTPKNGECHCARTHKAVPAGKNAFRCVKPVVIDPVKPDKGGKRVDSTSGYPKKTRGDAEADKKRLEALKRKQAQEVRRKAAEAEKRRKALAAQQAAREARKKAAEAAKRKQQLELRKARMQAAQQARSVKVKKRRKKRKRRAQ